jgi:hypothetical protein
MSEQSNTESIFNINKNIIIMILALTVSFFGGRSLTTGSVSSEDPVKTLTKNLIKDIMSSEIQQLKNQVIELKKEVALNTEFRIDEYIKLILKNAKKITSDPDDVKRSDIDLCLSYLPKIPDERKTEDVQAAIAKIIEWDQQNP